MGAWPAAGCDLAGLRKCSEAQICVVKNGYVSPATFAADIFTAVSTGSIAARDHESSSRAATGASFGPWNPGITSDITPEIWRLCTIFRPENVSIPYDDAVEFRDLTGLSLPQLVVWRPERLVLHEVLVQTIADYEVPDPEGADVASLGINFRRMTNVIRDRYVAPRMDQLIAGYVPLHEAIGKIVSAELARAFERSTKDAPRPRQSGWRRPWFGRYPGTQACNEDATVDDERVVASWRRAAREDDVAPAYEALITVMCAIRGTHGAMWGNRDVLEPLITGLACNVAGAKLMRPRIATIIAEVASREGFRRLPAQAHPVGISTKGASAAGKSTMRPLLRSIAARMGANWSDFALVSPDIFRRDLLDIGSLGSHYKYFGTCTCHELEVVDRKLDEHLAAKADRHEMSHVLVDRFRFDSFAPESDEQKRLFARLGQRRMSYYLYMVTPPAKTVERAWIRGERIGRYKPVDDLLAHNVEAYTGMQTFFFGRTRHPTSRNQHHEFVDNDVPMGAPPLTIAFGSQDELNVLDVLRMVDMDRYRRINVNARSAEELFPDSRSWAVEENVEFLAACIDRFPAVNFAHRDTGRVYARFEQRRPTWVDHQALASVDGDALTALIAAAPALVTVADNAMDGPRYLDATRSLTLGRWGPSIKETK